MARKSSLPLGVLVVDASLLIGVVDRDKDAQSFISVLSSSG
jgi:hypothetical protein